MTIEIVEGDFVIPGNGGNDLLRMHVNGDDFWFTVNQQTWTIASVSEAKELRDWLTRRLDEER